ncbi:MAG: protoporphyrinogen oxidase [Nitrospirae bacterium]|nr:protoporphyrinogen oxidase [Candidatus Manganitrophaceae bacterium]
MDQASKKVVIIGGGITGLATAYFLQEKIKEAGLSIDCTLIEVEPRFGGKVVTERVDGFVMEGGPDSFITQKPGALDLCNRLGLTDRLIQTNPTEKAIFILSNGKLCPMPEGFNLMVPGRVMPFLWSPLVSPFGKARMGLDLMIPRRGGAGDESIASFVRRRLGQEAVDRFAEPILAGIYAGDAEKLSLRATFPQFAQMERDHGSLVWAMWMRRWEAAKKLPRKSDWSLFVSLREGLSSLIDAVRSKLDRVTLLSGRKVIGVRPHPNPPNPIDGRYEISLDGEQLLADAVVITTKTHTAADWIDGWDAALAKRLRENEYVSTATVSLGFRKADVRHPLNGFGVVIPRREKRKIMAMTWTSTKFPGRAPEGHILIRSFVGGAHQEGFVHLDDAALISTVREELRTILKIDAAPVVSRVFRWIKANPQYNVGHLDWVDAVEKETAKHPGFFLAGAAYRGVGLPDCIHQGRETAEKISRLLSSK